MVVSPSTAIRMEIDEENGSLDQRHRDDESEASIFQKVLETRCHKSGQHPRKGSHKNRGYDLEIVNDNNTKIEILVKEEKHKSTFREFMANITKWDKEMKKLVKLWIPFSIAGASDGLFQIVNVAIISHFIGVNEANAYVVVIILVEFTATLTYGWENGMYLGKFRIFYLFDPLVI